MDQAAPFEIATKRVPVGVYASRSVSTRAVVGRTVLAMLVAAVVWVGLGYLWSQLFPAPTTTATTGAFQWALPLNGLSNGIGWTLTVREQVAIIPEQLRALDLPSLGATLRMLFLLLVELLVGQLPR